MSSDGKMFEKIVKEPLRTAIRRQLIDRLFAGDLEPGEQLNERELADQLGISRTPLREALIGLEYEGLVEARQSRGFRVASLDGETLVNLCEIVGTLEAMALRDLPEVPGEKLEELDELTRRRMESDTPGETIRFDALWHRTLIEGCENDELIQLVELLRTRLYFYEYAYLKKMGDLEESYGAHLKVTEALRSDGTGKAAELLEAHWQTGVETMGEWLDDSNA